MMTYYLEIRYDWLFYTLSLISIKIQMKWKNLVENYRLNK